MAMIIALFLLVAVDLGLKYYVEKNFGDHEIHTYLDGKLKVRKLHNHGFLMGKAKENKELVRRSTLAVSILVGLEWLFLLPSRGRHLLKTGMTLLFAGAISNTADRFTKGYVTDYLSVKTGKRQIDRVVFNIADVCILIGGLITLFASAGKSVSGNVKRAAKTVKKTVK